MKSRLLALVLVAVPAAVAATPAECRSLRYHGKRTEAQSCFQTLSLTRDPYVMAEGLWGLGMFEDAKSAFELALKAEPKNVMYRVRYGRMFHERYNLTDAAALFEEAINLDPNNAGAYLGLALVSAEGFDNKAVAYATKALELDPNLVEAHELMANLELEDSDEKAAAEEADKALKISSEALGAMAVHAAIEVLEDRSPQAWLSRMDAVNPVYGEGRATIAHHLVLNRRYEEAIDYYRKGLDLDPQLWPARSQLGINLMRVGKDQEARQQLEMCFNNGWRDIPTANSLNLLDSYKNFVTYKTGDTIIKLNKKEAELLHPYVEALLKKAMATYERKYKFKLPGPVQVEVYPDHEDFAVRTMGLPGLGALGVTFGEVVAMDSPSGRKPGSFHWGSTLWHELSHVYAITETNSRLPRWFAEGLAVHEETAVDPSWGDRLSPEIIAALRDKKLLPIADLDRGFIRPKFPSQIIVSYFQGGRIIDYITGRWGFQTVLDMLHDFGARKTTPEVIRERLKMEPADFDKDFFAWLDAQTGKTVAHFEEWRKKLVALADLHKEAKYDEIIAQGQEVIDMYPDYVEAASAYEALADAYLVGRKDKESAARVLAAYAKTGGRNPDTLKQLATLQEELGHPKEAAATLDSLNYIYPVGDEDLHRRLGTLWLDQGNDSGAIREFKSVIALNPLDKAEAHYDLARAYSASGQRDLAEDQVLASLEAAPGYRPAQKLLLELEDTDKEKR